MGSDLVSVAMYGRISSSAYHREDCKSKNQMVNRHLNVNRHHGTKLGVVSNKIEGSYLSMCLISKERSVKDSLINATTLIPPTEVHRIFCCNNVTVTHGNLAHLKNNSRTAYKAGGPLITATLSVIEFAHASRLLLFYICRPLFVIFLSICFADYISYILPYLFCF